MLVLPDGDGMEGTVIFLVFDTLPGTEFHVEPALGRHNGQLKSLIIIIMITPTPLISLLLLLITTTITMIIIKVIIIKVLMIIIII